MSTTEQPQRPANLCCGHVTCQREVERLVAEAKREVLTDLQERLVQANHYVLDAKRAWYGEDPDGFAAREKARLEHKASGIRLALSYVEEGLR